MTDPWIPKPRNAKMPQDSPKLPTPMPGRPLPDMTANINELVDRLRAKLIAWDAAGEVLVKVDVLQFEGVFTLHIPIPK